MIAAKVDGILWLIWPGHIKISCWRRLLFVAAIFVAIVILGSRLSRGAGGGSIRVAPVVPVLLRTVPVPISAL